VTGVLLLITGASGVGKSTVRALVAPRLPLGVDAVELSDLAPRGVAPTQRWRQQGAEAAVRRAVELQASGRHLLLAGDPVPAIEIVAAPSSSRLDGLAVCLLDAIASAQAERLAGRGDDPALLVHHQAFAEWMRRQADDPLHMAHVVSDQSWGEMRWERLEAVTDRWQMHTIDTSAPSREAVAAEVLTWCRHALAGEAPVMRVD
jgi:hypothetical protein